MGLCERIANVVISFCRILFLMTDFPACISVGLWWAPRTSSKFVFWAVDWLRKSAGLPGRGRIAGGWFGWAVLIFRSTLRRRWLSSLMSMETGVDRWDWSSLLEIMLTSSLIRWEDWLSWPSSSKKSTCNCISLRRLINLICLLRIDVAVFWCVAVDSSRSATALWVLFLAGSFNQQRQR